MQTGVDNRKQFGFKNKGGGFFALLNATFQDSGVYHCVVIRQGKIIGNGTGSNLTVCAPPTPLKLFSKPPQNNSATTLHLVCESAAFYPGDFTLVWYKNGTKVATGINPKKWQNAEGLYEVSSSLEDMQPVPNGAVYICLVSHISLQVPAIGLYAVNNSCSEPDDKYYYIWGSGCAVGGLAFLVFMIIIGTRCSLKNKGKQESRTILSTHEGLGEEDKIVTYAAVDLNKAKKTPGRKHEEEMTAYAQIKQGTFRDKVTEATPELSGSKKAGQSRNNRRSAEYAELEIKTTKGATEAFYTEARTN
ncbi:uncharacterized protein [Heterodontus francisci]